MISLEQLVIIVSITQVIIDIVFLIKIDWLKEKLKGEDNE